MIKKDKILIPILVSVLSFNILLANNLIPAYATSFNNVTLPSGAIAQDSQMYLGGGSSNRAWWTAVTGGVLHLYTKGNNIFGTSNDNVLSGGGGYMAYDTFRNYLWVITSSTIYRFNGANNALIDATSTAIFTDPQDIVYDSTRDRMYALNRATSTIYDISASNPSSYTAWTNSNMGGYNTLLNAATKLAVDGDDGKLFFNVPSGLSTNTVTMITNLSGTWNQTRTVGSLSSTTPFSLDVDKTFDFLFVTISDGSAVKKYSYAVTTGNMSLLATITVGSVPRHIVVGSDSHKGYIGHSAANTVDIFDTTSNIVQSTNATCTTPLGHLSVKEITTSNPINYVTITCTANNTDTIVYDTASSESGGNIVNGINCSLPENEHKLVCAISTGTQYSLPQQLLNQSANTLYCQTGIIACTDNGNGGFTPVDSNPQTNGLGYIMAIIGIGVMIGIFWVASDGQLTSVPTFIWFIGTIAVLGALTGFGYIDPTFLIIGIFAIISFAVAKAKGLFSGGSIFAGETA